jgi:hypothetical protein
MPQAASYQLHYSEMYLHEISKQYNVDGTEYNYNSIMIDCLTAVKEKHSTHPLPVLTTRLVCIVLGGVKLRC